MVFWDFLNKIVCTVMGALFDIRYLLGNVMLVLLISVLYSLIELLNLKINTRTILTTKWGLFYLVLNGTLAVLALVTTFRSEVNSGIIMTKVILSGTSALAYIDALDASGVERFENADFVTYLD